MTKNERRPQGRGWLTANLVSQLAFGLLAMTICLPSMQDWPTEFQTASGANRCCWRD
jgi:DHA1 family bicyclomycin/chloramphenicol resistance-like MFS transporter